MCYYFFVMNENSFQINIVPIWEAEIGFADYFSLSGKISDEQEIKFLEPVQVELNIEKIDEGIMASGHLATKVELVCDRCAKVFAQKIEIDFERIFSEQPEGEEEKIQNVLDFLPIIREEIILSLPIKILCNQNCQGLDK